MKQGIIFLLFGIVLILNVYGQNSNQLQGFVDTLKPGSLTEKQDSVWLDVYSTQLRTLLDKKKISPATYLVSASFCQKVELPENPVIAAFMVYDLITETDFLLRSGFSMSEVKVRMNVVWKKQLKENKTLLETGAKPKKVKKNRTDLGSKKEITPKVKKEKPVKIKDKTKKDK